MSAISVPKHFSSNGVVGVDFCGWSFRSHKGPIASSSSMDELSSRLDIKGLPEMVYDQNFLSVTHDASQSEIKFSVEAALQRCLLDSSSSPPVASDKASDDVAKEQKIQKDDMKEITHSADAGPLKRAWSLRPSPVVVPDAKKWKTRVENTAKAETLVFSHDWTFSTDYTGSVTRGGKIAEGLFKETTQRIDIELLKRPDPIVWYESLQLFEDELHDNGISETLVKIRIMPTCFFVLFRFWLRVDGAMIRVFDTRIFHKFGSAEVIREFTAREASFDQLRELRHPTDNKFYSEPDRFAPKLPVIFGKLESMALDKQ